MRDDHEFNKSFVMIIRKYDVLYNHRLEKYSDRDERESAWQKIADEVESTTEKCKRRWRTLRLGFVRHLREARLLLAKSGKAKKPYYLYESIKFLLPYTNVRRQSKKETDCDEDTASFDFDDNAAGGLEENNHSNHDGSGGHFQNISHNYNDMDNIVYCENIKVSPRELESASSSRNHHHHHHQHQHHQSSSFADSVNEQLTNKKRTMNKCNNERWDKTEFKCLLTDSNSRECNNKEMNARQCTPLDEDADFLFLKSLLPDMKKLNDTQKIRFKQRIFMIFEEVFNDHTACPSTFRPITTAISVSSHDST